MKVKLKKRTHKGAAKRVKKTGTGKFRTRKAAHNHLKMNKKRTVKRNLDNAYPVSKSNEEKLKKLIPHK